MLKNYFTIAFRTLQKNKTFAFINILGLAIGISASLVIYLLADYHFSFDKFQKDGDRIFRLVSVFNISGVAYNNSGVTSPMGAAIKKDLTGLDEIVPFRTIDGEAKLTVPLSGNKEPVVFKHQKNIVFAEENLLRLLNYEWLAGSFSTSLKQSYQTVLTESIAKRYFPEFTAPQVIGREIYLNDTVRLSVSGIVKDLPHNTDFTFTTFISRATLENTSLKPDDWEQWDNTNEASQLLLKLSKGTSARFIQNQIAALYKKYHKSDPEYHSNTEYVLQPLSELHFNTDFGGYGLPIANKPTLYALLSIAAFLLMLGCINFINLTTAHTAQRAKEIGIRKTMGSLKSHLILQFLCETFLLTLIATLLSVCLVPVILKAFSGFIPEGLHFDIAAQPGIIGFLSLLIIVVTVLSGFYPAVILSGYKPVLVLKNQAYANTGKTRSSWVRKTLTISQFTIAQVFIMGTILVSKQISYSLNKDMGFKKDAIVFFNTNYYDTVRSHKFVLLEKLRAIPEIAMVSLGSNPPSSYNNWSGPVKYHDGKKEIEVNVQQKFGDTNYIKLYRLKLLAGKNLLQSDTVKELLINQTYAKVLGFQQPELAVGKFINWNGKQIPIAGVIADFNQRSLHEPIKPLILGSYGNVQRNISISLKPQNPAGTTWKTAIGKMEKAFNEVYPTQDLNYKFFDEEIGKYYEAEKNVSSLLKWATGLAILISCLGLLGLVIYTTTQRTKEIGVRKVLGASITQIVTMISKDFILLVMVAFVIATPVSWLGMNKWLENFADRTSINLWIFLLGGSFMAVIALFTLSFQTIRAAMMNPVKSLRTE